MLAEKFPCMTTEARRGSWISPLSGREGQVPVLLQDPGLQKLTSRRQVLSALKRSLGGDAVGRIAMTSRGYVVDLPLRLAQPLLTDPVWKDVGVEPQILQRMPPVSRICCACDRDGDWPGEE